MIKRYMEIPENAKRVEFISVEKEFTGTFFDKIKITSQPKYFVTHVYFKFKLFF